MLYRFTVDCEWNDWDTSKCGEACKGRLVNKTRTIKQKPKYNGKPCNGTSWEACECEGKIIHQ